MKTSDCPICDKDVVEFNEKLDRFKYDVGKSAIYLSAIVIVGKCKSCNFEFIDQRGEKARDDAIAKHRKSLRL